MKEIPQLLQKKKSDNIFSLRFAFNHFKFFPLCEGSEVLREEQNNRVSPS